MIYPLLWDLILEKKHLGFAVRYTIVNPFYWGLAFLSRLTTINWNVLQGNSQCRNNVPEWPGRNLVMSTASEQCSTPRAACSKSTTQYRIILCIVWNKLCLHLHHFCNGDILAWEQVRPDSRFFYEMISNKQDKLCMIIVLSFIKRLWRNICIPAKIFAWMKNYPHWNQTRLFDISTEINLVFLSAKGLWA